MKTCSRCRVEQSAANFHKGNNYCKPCKKEYDQTYRHKWAFAPYNQVKRYLGHIQKRYNLTLEGITSIYESQNGSCAVCLRAIPNPAIEGSERFITSIDHDHSCCPTQDSCGLCIRGLLCRDCNLLLGHAKDSPETLKRAIEYLENTKVGNQNL